MAVKNKATKTNVPALPETPSDVSPSTKIWMAAVKEALEIRLGRRGDTRDRAITLRELIESGLAKALKDNPFDTSITDLDFLPYYDDPGELDVPPTPANLQASGGFTKIVLSWTAGWTVYSNHKHAEIWRHTSDALGDALLIGTTAAGLFTDTVDMGSTYYYWVRNVSKTDVVSGFAGEVHASTAEDIGAIMTSLSETLAGLPGYSLLQTAAASIEIIQASGAPDGNTNRADGSDPHPGDIYVNTANSQQYVRNAANNGWIRAVDATLVTTVNSQASSISTNASAISTANTNISNLTTTTSAHTTSINSLNSTVAAKVDVYRDSSEPSGGTYVSGDLWVDTDDNQLYQYNGSAWVTARDAGLATATALSSVSSTATTANNLAATKITTFRQNDIPTSLHAGDMWVDTNDSNKMYFAQAAGADAITSGEWVIAADSIITSAGASITTLETTTATLTGDAAAAYVLNVNANGSVAGMVIEANASSSGDNVGSAVQFMADKFAIWNATGSGSGSAAVAPFIVDSGTVYMDMARIKDGAIQTAKIGTAAIDTARIADAAITTAKIGDLEVTTAKIYDASITEAKIGNAAITTAKIANAAITNAKITSLYANTLNGDVSKAISGTLASSQTWNNLISGGATTYDYQLLIELSLPKPTHPDGWIPYASFNINKMSTDKNSWSHIKIEMAIWNVNSVGTNASETATSNTNVSAFGNGFDGATIYDNYWYGATGTQTDPGNADPFITWTTANIIAEDGTGAHNTSLLPTTSDWLSDGTTHRQITSAGVVGSTYVVSYTGAVVSSFGTGNIYFREAIASNGTGRYVNVAKTDWIAVDDAYNDFAIAGVWSNEGGSGSGYTRTAAAVSHGVKAKMSLRGHEQHGSSEQGSDDETVEEATAFLMGVR